jgi:hypothetical protein
LTTNTPTADQAKTPEGNIAVIFDSEVQSRRKTSFVSRVNAATNTFSDRVKFVPEVTPGSPNQPAFVDQDKVIDLLNGVNLGIPEILWELHSNGDRFKYYESAGAFEVIRPIKGKDGYIYSDYKPEDAIKLIQATLSETLLRQYGTGEERPLVLEELKLQQEAIKEELEARIARGTVS